eukprot:GAHX01006200.1.p1 GENE.GAHX01006200.1~~GAHX01006200.1.p1  ORF type:complete len:79 (-),score=2.27 GAHX01006200.1:59-295(-)
MKVIRTSPFITDMNFDLFKLHSINVLFNNIRLTFQLYKADINQSRKYMCSLSKNIFGLEIVLNCLSIITKSQYALTVI